MSALYHLLDVRLELDAPEDVIAGFDRMYGGLRDAAACGWPADAPVISVPVAVTGTDAGWTIATPWGRFEPGPGEVMVHLLFLAQNHVLRNSRAFCVLHAASLELDGRGVLLAAPSATGKTTLAGALAMRGARLLSDEVGALQVGTGAVHAFPRAVAFRPDVLPSLPVKGEAVVLGQETKVLVPPERVGEGALPATTKPGVIVFLVPPPDPVVTGTPCLELSLSIAPAAFAREVEALEAVTSVAWLDGRAYRTLRILHAPGALLVRDIDRLARETGAVVAGHHRGASAPIDFSASPQSRELPGREGLTRLLPCILNAEALAAAAAPGPLLVALTRLLDGVRYLEVVPGRLAETAERVETLVADRPGGERGSPASGN